MVSAIMDKTKIIFILFDGGADRPQHVLGGLTPFEYGNIPMIDNLAKNGCGGQLTFLPFNSNYPDIPGPTSDQAHLMLLGETEEYTNRGEFMAWGIGLNPSKGDLCCRAYLKSRIDKTLIRFSPTLERKEANKIEKRFNNLFLPRINQEDVKVTFKFDPFANNPRWGSIIISGKDLSLGQEITTPDHLPKLEYLSDNNIAFQILCHQNKHEDSLPSNISQVLNQIRCKVPNDIKSQRAASLLKQFVEMSINNFLEYPIEVSAFKMTAGMIQPTEPSIAYGSRNSFSSKWGNKIRCASITEKIEVHGVMRTLGFEESILSSNILDSYKEVFDTISNNDFIFIQFKDTDNLSHDNDVQGKVKLIEEIDSFVHKIYKQFHDTIFIVTADHTTPCGLYQRIHTREPVPFIISGKGIKPDSVTKFGEKFSKNGLLGLLPAKQFMSIVRKYAKQGE